MGAALIQSIEGMKVTMRRQDPLPFLPLAGRRGSSRLGVRSACGETAEGLKARTVNGNTVPCVKNASCRRVENPTANRPPVTSSHLLQGIPGISAILCAFRCPSVHCDTASQHEERDLAGSLRSLRRSLEQLSSDAGAKLLRALGVKGREAELRSASEDFGGHFSL
jgi:hypothetical protein